MATKENPGVGLTATGADSFSYAYNERTKHHEHSPFPSN